MLSLFPELLDWSFFVPFFFRVFIGLYLIAIGYRFIKKSGANKKQDVLAWGIFGSLLVLIALCLLIGAYVQIAGAVTFIMSLKTIYFRKRGIPELNESIAFYALFALVALSLVFLGAGAYAFDLPL